MGLEYERKYAATPALLEAILQQRQDWQCYRMQTTYYDTWDLALSGRKWTLRRRLENETSVCALKTPAGAARGEWEVEADTIEEGIEKLCKLDVPPELALLTHGGVEPVCGARFTRHAALLEAPGCRAELALDAGCLFAGETTEPLCEIELELKAGTPEALDAFAGELAQRYGLKILAQSKFKRALALRRK